MHKWRKLVPTNTSEISYAARKITAVHRLANTRYHPTPRLTHLSTPARCRPPQEAADPAAHILPASGAPLTCPPSPHSPTPTHDPTRPARRRYRSGPRPSTKVNAAGLSGRNRPGGWRRRRQPVRASPPVGLCGCSSRAALGNADTG